MQLTILLYITQTTITDSGVFKWFSYYLISIKSRTTEVDPNQETKQNKLELKGTNINKEDEIEAEAEAVAERGGDDITYNSSKLKIRWIICEKLDLLIIKLKTKKVKIEKVSF
jgi:hypothetical protein